MVVKMTKNLEMEDGENAKIEWRKHKKLLKNSESCSQKNKGTYKGGELKGQKEWGT